MIVLGGGSRAHSQTSALPSGLVTREQAPLAFEAGDPFRVIASLELLAVLFGVNLLVPGKSWQRFGHGHHGNCSGYRQPVK